MNKRDVVIFGAGGHGRVILDILSESGRKVIGFLDENKDKAGHLFNGVPVLGGWDYLKANNICEVALGVGDNTARHTIFRKLKSMDILIASAVHPKAVISKHVKMAEGVVVMGGVVINTGTVLEEGVVVNTSSSVDHDCHLGMFCQIWPGAHLAGNIKIGKFSCIGTGASLVPGIKIGKKVIIGAGAAVISNIDDGATAVGVPAKIIKRVKI